MPSELKSRVRNRAAKTKRQVAANTRRKKVSSSRRTEVAGAFGKWLDQNIDHVNTWVRENTKKLTGKESL